MARYQIKEMHHIRGQFLCISQNGAYYIVHEFDVSDGSNAKVYRVRNDDEVRHLDGNVYEITHNDLIIIRED